MPTTCQLCDRDSKLFWNMPLFESPNFLVLPSLGALVEGWLLLLPKEHFLTFGSLPEALIPEMQDLKNMAVDCVDQHYGRVSVFEHGPSATAKRVGCGVDHAHLHIVPTDCDLIRAASPFLPANLSWANADLDTCRHAHAAGDDYLYVEQPIGSGKLISHCDLGSQIFRRAIASHLGIPEKFSWRENAQLENIERTITTIREDSLLESKRWYTPEYAA
jgi:ATP adenylyltransferase